MPSQPVTGICANFAKTSSYGKEQQVEASVKQIRAEMNRLVNEQMLHRKKEM